MSKLHPWMNRLPIVGLACLLSLGIISLRWYGDDTAIVMAEDAPPAKPVPTTVEPTGYGTFVGQIVLDGEPPFLPPLVKKGAAVKDASCSRTEIPDEQLVIDSKTHGIRDVFVYITNAPRIHPELRKSSSSDVSVRAEGCRYVPHAAFVRTDQVISFRVLDDCGHSAHAYPARNSSYCSAIRPYDMEFKLSYKTAERLPFRVSCDIHPWMRGHWLVLDHPYAAITDPAGKFRIDKLPAGDYQFLIWHESAGHLNKELKVKIQPDQTTDQGQLQFEISRFKLK